MGTREILFRGKRVDNGEWVEGSLVSTNDGGRFILPSGSKVYIPENKNTISSCEFYEVVPETVCEYTGLTDKNGRKIFEGDVVRDIFNASVVGIVKYGEYRNTFNDDEYGGHVGFYIEWQGKKKLNRKDLVYWVKNSEFIGNVFDGGFDGKETEKN